MVFWDMMPCQMVHSNQSFRMAFFLWSLRQRQQNTSNMSVTAYHLTKKNWIFINVPVRSSKLTKVSVYIYMPYVCSWYKISTSWQNVKKQTKCYLTTTNACTNPSHVVYNIFYIWHPLHDVSYTFLLLCVCHITRFWNGILNGIIYVQISQVHWLAAHLKMAHFNTNTTISQSS